MRRYAELNADVWYILSAKHGLLRPDEIVDPYEQTLNAMPRHDRFAWAERVRSQLLEMLPRDAELLVLASQRYREQLVPFLKSQGYVVRVPMAGLKFGPQLRWLKAQTTTSQPGLHQKP
jgi:hypothetical protein